MQRRALALIATTGLVLVLSCSTALAQYQITNLVSNQIGHAQHIDPLDVNAWGSLGAQPHHGGSVIICRAGQPFTIGRE
jgi:hypothetical protein